jgi:uncharacterized protein (TIGR03067 family)
MVRVAVVVVASLWLGVPLGADDGKPNPLPERANKELDQLQGRWVAKEFGRYGKTVDVKDHDLVLEIKGDKWIFAGKEKAVFVDLDPTTEPKCFDLKSVEEGRMGQVEEGIYRVDGETLTICFYQGSGKSRPTKFETSPDQPDTILAMFERSKKK